MITTSPAITGAVVVILDLSAARRVAERLRVSVRLGAPPLEDDERDLAAALEMAAVRLRSTPNARSSAASSGTFGSEHNACGHAPPDRMLTASEVARKRGVTQQTVTRMARAGRIPGAVRKGRTWLFSDEAA